MPNIYVGTNDVIKKITAIYARAPKRRLQWRKKINPDCNLPKFPCETRWMSWLQSVKDLNTQNKRNAIVKHMRILQNDKKARTTAKELEDLLSDATIIAEIEQIVTLYDGFIDAKDFLERRNSTVRDLVRIVGELKSDLANESVPDSIRTKMVDVFDTNNPGYCTIRDWIEKGDETGLIETLSSEEKQFLLNAPGANSDSERGFSITKLLLQPNRNNFGYEAFRQHAVSYMFMNASKVT